MRYVESLNLALHDLLSQDSRVILIGEDLHDPYGGAFKVSRGLSTKFPDRVISTPISEAGLVGMGIGLGLRGFLPIVEIMFGDFMTLACDQLVNSAVKFHSMYNGKVTSPLLVRTPMGGRRGYGPTHSQTLETLFFNVPDFTIIAPSQLHDPGAQLSNIVQTMKSPILFVENKGLYPVEIISSETAEFDIFQLDRIQHANTPGLDTVRVSIRGNDDHEAVLAAYGGMIPTMLEAMKVLFMEDEICTRLYVPSLVKPLPDGFLKILAEERRKLIVCEESSRYAGWGAELVAQIAEDYAHLLLPVGGVCRIGAKDSFIPCCRELENAVLPQVEDIVRAVRERHS